MLRFLFGLAVGAFGAAAYLHRQTKGTGAREAAGGPAEASPATVGRVHELAGAVSSPGAPDTINAGDGTPRRTGAPVDEDHAVPSDATRH